MVRTWAISKHEQMLERSQRERDLPPGTGALSKREWDVLALVSQGLTNGQIAERLSLSVHGVKFHLASILRKLRVDNRTAAAALYLSEPRGRPE